MDFGKKIIIILIVLLGLVSWIVFFNFKNKSSSLSVSPSPVVAVESYSTVPAINFPEISSRKETKPKERFEVDGQLKVVETNLTIFHLPLDYRSLIPADAQKLKIYKINYVNADPSQLYGHEINYTLDSANHTLSDIYKMQLDESKIIGWTILAAKLDQSSFFIENNRDIPGLNQKLSSTIEKEGNTLHGKIIFLINRQ